MTVKFFNPGLGYQKIKSEIDHEIQRVLAAGDLILREDGERFEKNLAEFVGTKYAVGLNSGTDALYLALKALGIGKQNVLSFYSVLVPSHTFVATAQVVVQAGAMPILYDLNQNPFETMPDVSVNAVILAHIAGAMDIHTEAVIQEAHKRGIPVIEDACQALGATLRCCGKAGTLGKVGCFSFYPAKLLGAYGDAGALVTNDESIANEVRELRNHYKKDYSKWGINSRLDNIQAAVLNVKLKYLPEALLKRAEIAKRYSYELGAYPIGLPEATEGRVWQDYIIRVEERDRLYDFLKEQGVETMKNEYPFPIEKLPKSLEYEAETLRIPCNEHLTDDEVSYVIAKIKEFYE